jgi:hypothetical protein
MVESTNKNLLMGAAAAAGALLVGYFAYRSMGSSASEEEKKLEFAELCKTLPDILANIPKEWDGTTFNNSDLLGRPKFSENFIALVKKSIKSGTKITEADLTALGNAQDYLRVSTNISTIVETAYALKYNRTCD